MAADLLAEVASGDVLRLRDFDLRPCTGCGACARDGLCVLASGDQGEELFAHVEAANALALTAPVYFYHLPSQAKAWIDRAQSRFVARQSGWRPRGPRRRAFAVLVAGRPQGEKLFAGIELTLRYFLDIFDFDLADTVLLRGVDGQGALAANACAVRAVRELGLRKPW